MGGVAWAATRSERDAADAIKASAGSDTGTVKTLNAALNLLYALLTPLLMLAGWLLTPDWAFGEIF